MKFTIILLLLGVGEAVSRTMDEIIAASVNLTGNGMNIPNSPNIVKVELDMVFRRDVWQEMQGETLLNSQPAHREKRKAISHLIRRWPRRTIPFAISSAFNNAERNEIMSAINHWRQVTCLHFREKRSRDRRYVQFVTDPFSYYGCASHVGMQRRGQALYLAIGCREKKTIIHEIGHAVGFVHEQSRPDRDNYVIIKRDNIRRGMEFNFNKRSDSEINSYSVPYDYFSIMHYGTTYFSKDGESPTIVTTDPDYQDTIGTATELSDRDIQLVNAMYRCGEADSPAEQTECIDVTPFKCSIRKRLGHCVRKSGFMPKNCQKTCGHCT